MRRDVENAQHPHTLSRRVVNGRTAANSDGAPRRRMMQPAALSMAIQLDHLIVPSHDPVAGAKSLAGLLDVPWQEAQGPFTPVYVNETLTLDFADRDQFEPHHYCFRVSDAEFDAILGRIEAARIPYRSSPLGETDMQISHRLGGKNSTGRTRTVTLGDPHRELCPGGFSAAGRAGAPPR